MSDIDEALAAYNYDEESVWDLAKEKFLRCTADTRQAYIQSFDKWTRDNEKMSTMSRETADLIARKRELLSIHNTLRQLGR